MRTPLGRLALGLAFCSCLCLLPARAGADVHLAFGTKWQPLRYTTDPYAAPQNTSLLANPKPDIGGPSGFQSTSIDPYLALYFAQRYGIVLGLDMGYGKTLVDTQMGMASKTTSDSFFQFGFSLGFKWYLLQPRGGKISPYLYADFYKYFVTINTDANQTNDAVSFAAALLSPIGATMSFGAEYFVTPGFSVGSEVFGIKVASVSADMGDSMNHTSQSYTYFTFYTGITLNYRFQVQATTVQVSEEEGQGEEAPRRKKKKAPEAEAPPPPAPPPPTPEAVD